MRNVHMVVDNVKLTVCIICDINGAKVVIAVKRVALLELCVT